MESLPPMALGNSQLANVYYTPTMRHVNDVDKVLTVTGVTF